jgi:methionine--tRNA ligase beta chain
MISYEEFKKVEIRAGKILAAEKVPDTDKLLKLAVDFGEKSEMGESKPRQIVSGIALHFPDPTTLIGKTCMFVANLEPRTIKGLESQGMLFAVSTPEGGFSILEPNQTISPGALAA